MTLLLLLLYLYLKVRYDQEELKNKLLVIITKLKEMMNLMKRKQKILIFML